MIRNNLIWFCLQSPFSFNKENIIDSRPNGHFGNIQLGNYSLIDKNLAKIQRTERKRLKEKILEINLRDHRTHEEYI